ncbi:MAG: PEP-CTERM sorting domain-containing protein [Myxococcota bacterium]|nr:PEP-CTERM sorting domain-containing protein [Myxococcota bacterium]
MKRGFGFLVVLALALVSVLSTAGMAVGSTVTMTFDAGGYDPNPAACNYHGPYDYIEDGARVGGVWLQDYGLPTAELRCGHTHIDPTTYPGAAGNAIMDHPWLDAVQVLRISMENGDPFSVLSIDTRVRYRWLGEVQPNFERPDWSWDENEVHMLLSTSFDPATAINQSLAQIESYFTAYAIDDQTIYYSGSDPRPNRPARTSPFITTQIQGMSGTELYLLSTGGTYFDNITLLVSPEPNTALLLGLGLAFLGARRQR